MLRSIESTEPAKFIAVNNTTKCIEIIWHNYYGIMERYGTLCPLQCLSIGTYKTHPWTFIDRITGEKMQVLDPMGCRTFDYLPLSALEVKKKYGRDVQLPVLIHSPMLTLSRLSLHAVLSCLKNINDIERLDLPNGLIEDLRTLHQDKQKLFAQVSPSFQVFQ